MQLTTREPAREEKYWTVGGQNSASLFEPPLDSRFSIEVSCGPWGGADSDFIFAPYPEHAFVINIKLGGCHTKWCRILSIHCLQDFCDVLGGSSRTLSRTLVLVKHPIQFRRRLDNVEEHLNSAEWSDCSRQQLGTGVTMTTVSVVVVTLYLLAASMQKHAANTSAAATMWYLSAWCWRYRHRGCWHRLAALAYP